MGTPQSSLESLTSPARMASLVFILLLPLMAAAAPKNQKIIPGSYLGPIDLAQCMGKCPVSPLEFAKCSVECAKGSEERGLLGDLITGPVDLAQCMGKCPVNPLEFAKCSVECAKGSEEKNRGLMGDLAGCVIQCKLTPDGTCKNGPLGLPKPCSLINLATDFATG